MHAGCLSFVRGLLYTSCVLFSSCTHIQQGPLPDSLPSDAVAVVVPIKLLPPNMLPEPMTMTQALNITYKGRTEQIDALLQWGRSDMRLALMKFGRRVMTIAYDGRQVTEDKDPRVPDFIKGEQVLFDIQQVFLPEVALRNHLSKDYTVLNSGGNRVVSYKGRPVYKITYSSSDFHSILEGRVHLTHLIYGYEMTIDAAILPE